MAVKRAGKQAATRSTPAATPAENEAALDGFIARFADADRRLIRAVRRAMRQRLPTANEMVYDNYNFLVIGYSPNERPSDAIFSITARADAVGLCFLRGAGLPDPHRVLQGSGSQTRFVRLDSAATLARPEIAALMALAIRRSRVRLPATGKGRLIIRSISARQRPRRRPSR
jgi:hypothetical protein